MLTTASSARSSKLEDVLAYIYDIPKSPAFTNKSLTAYFQENGWKNTQVQIVKDCNNDENSKPFRTARVKFYTSAYLKQASEKLKYFEFEGH